MIRVCICDPRPKARATLRHALETLAEEAGLAPFAVMQHESALDACLSLSESRPGYCSLLICNLDMAGEDITGILPRFKQRFPEVKLVLLSATPRMAADAYRMHADGFVLMGGGGDFARVVGGCLSQLAMQRRATITLKSKTGIDVLDADAVLFAETSNSGPVIHLADGTDVQLRGTLQALFDQMAHDARFVKAGGSFIVNLDNVRSAGKSSIVFPDGSVIIVPIRARKPFQEALDAYRRA